ncbi:MAG: glycosyltransferase [Cyanobacteriota bacterium]|nr:glycosyltransferase [Cyanobacteriota bacterium]
MNKILSPVDSSSETKVCFKQPLVPEPSPKPTRVALLVTTEYEGISRNGGIGTYYRTLSEKLTAAGFYTILLLSQTTQKFQGQSNYTALKHIFSTQECREVLKLPPPQERLLLQFHEWQWVERDNYCALFWACAIAEEFKNAYIYIEFPEMLGLGYRTVQAKRAGVLGKNCAIAVTLHSGQEWLAEAHESYTSTAPHWFWQTNHYERYSFERADFAFFPSYFLKEKVERYGWKTSHALHLPYCFSPLEPSSQKLILREDLQQAIATNRISVIFFGRLEERKGLFDFLEAIQLLDSRLTDQIQFLFLGKSVPLQVLGLQGLDSQQYIQQVLGSNYQYKIVTDLFSREAIQFIRQLNSPIVCLTSSQENFPHTALEMGQLSISLVVADTGGFRETLNLVERTAGIHWFVPGNPRSLAQVLVKAISAHPDKVEIPTREFLNDINQRLLNQRGEYIGQAFRQVAISFLLDKQEVRRNEEKDKNIETNILENQPRQWILGMTSMEEQLFLENYAQKEYTGRGEIVELGCWLGSSTISLARGLELNGSVNNKAEHIHAYDLFIWFFDSNMEKSVIGTSLEGKYQDGDSFLDEYLRRIAPWKHLVRVRPGDLTQIGWDRSPIELLFVDAMKSWELTNSIFKNFFPYLVPGFSLVVHQDFAHFYASWIHLMMYRFREYLVPIEHPFIWSSRVFRYVKEMPEHLLNATYSFEDFFRDEVEAAFNYSMEITHSKMQPNIMAAKVMYFVQILEFEQATVEYKKYITQLDSEERLELAKLPRFVKRYYSLDLLA